MLLLDWLGATYFWWMHILHLFIEDINSTLTGRFEGHQSVIAGFFVIDEEGDEFIHPKKSTKDSWLGTAESNIREQRVEALFVFERLKTGFSRHGTWWKWSVKRFMTPSGKYDWDVVSLCHFEKIKYLRMFNLLHVWGHLEDITDGLDYFAWILCKKRLRSYLKHLNGRKMSCWWLK